VQEWNEFSKLMLLIRMLLISAHFENTNLRGFVFGSYQFKQTEEVFEGINIGLIVEKVAGMAGSTKHHDKKLRINLERDDGR
jgi:hypothetical protein